MEQCFQIPEAISNFTPLLDKNYKNKNYVQVTVLSKKKLL